MLPWGFECQLTTNICLILLEENKNIPYNEKEIIIPQPGEKKKLQTAMLDLTLEGARLGSSLAGISCLLLSLNGRSILALLAVFDLLDPKKNELMDGERSKRSFIVFVSRSTSPIYLFNCRTHPSLTAKLYLGEKNCSLLRRSCEMPLLPSLW